MDVKLGLALFGEVQRLTVSDKKRLIKYFDLRQKAALRINKLNND
jgi:hypothetical protein